MGSILGIARPPTVITRAFRGATFAATRVTCAEPGLGLSNPIAPEDALLVSLQLRDFVDHDLWVDGRPIPALPTVRGTTTMLDLKGGPMADLRDPFDSLHLYLPRAAFDGVADDLETKRIATIHVRPGVPLDDPVIRHLGHALLPALEAPEQTSRLFVDQVAMALSTHIAQRYGGMAAPVRSRRAGLAPWQLRRAEELLMANLGTEATLEDVARECGLSRSHFARAFRAATGLPPHRWLLARRIERARELLSNTTIPVGEIGRQLGFADQSHLTRVFGRAFGAPPAAFRRAKRS